MVSSILVALDPARSLDALAGVAVDWADRLDAGLTAVALPGSDLGRPEAVPIGGSAYKARKDQTKREEQRAVLAATLERLSGSCSRRSLTCEVLFAEDLEGVMAVATRHDVVLVPASEGGGLLPGEPDRELRKVATDAARPVVAVPPERRAGRGVLVAFDGRPASARALLAFAASGLGRLGDTIVLSVARRAADAARLAEDGAAFLARHGVDARPRALGGSQSPAEAILAEADRLAPELVVLGAFGRSRLKQLVLGSVTLTVLDRVGRPVLVFG